MTAQVIVSRSWWKRSLVEGVKWGVEDLVAEEAARRGIFCTLKGDLCFFVVVYFDFFTLNEIWSVSLKM
jgi:hypothetical protein